MTLSVSPIAAAFEIADDATVASSGGALKADSSAATKESAPQQDNDLDVSFAHNDDEGADGDNNSSSDDAHTDAADSEQQQQSSDVAADTDDDASNQSEAATAAAVSDAASAPVNPKKHVRFDCADVLEFEPSAWTATVSSDGIPIGMSSTLRRRTRRRLDSFESERCLWRVAREEYMEHGYLEPDERLEILENAGHASSVIAHVEKETVRINRERWESNEYDLMYQYGLGEVPVMEMSEDEDDEMLFLAQPDDSGDELMQIDAAGDCASAANQDDAFYYGARGVLVDAEVRFAMEEMDAFDSRRYDDELAMDYAMDVILGDDDDASNADETNELPYAKDSFESPIAFALSDMASSPTDVCGAAESLLASCAARSKAPPSAVADAAAC